MSELWDRWEGLIADDRYKLVRYLGGSGHSAVYQTHSGAAGANKVAIKFIAADPQTAERLMDRWRVATKLSHPGLQTILDAGRCQIEGNDLLYVVTEFAQEDLSEILPQRALSAEETKEMLRPALDALQYLHEKRLVHTRVRPSNVLAIEDKIKLSADQLCPAGESFAPTEEKNLYAAPEDVAGVAVISSDIWSLGVTLVETLTQHHPSWQPGSTGELELVEKLPAPFDTIARHALVRETSRRWNIQDIRGELDRPKEMPAYQRRAFEAALSPEPAKPLKQAPADEKRALRGQEVTPRRGRRISPLWYVGPAIVGGAILVAYISLSRSVPHLPAENPAPSSAAAEAREPRPATTAPNTKTESKEPEAKPERKAVPQTRAAEEPPAQPTPEPAKLATPRVEKKKPALRTAQAGVVDQVLPDVSEKARNTIRGTVRVNVRVHADASGKVTSAELDSAGPSQYFAAQALSAAKKWEFNPASAPNEWLVHFEFKQSGTTATAKQIAD
jgi:TonB family protein